MNQLKKVFFALAAVVALGLLGTSSAHAKLTCTTASTPTLVRSEGTIEVVGKLDMNCITDGTGVVAASITLTVAPTTATVAPAVAGSACGLGGNNTSTFPMPTITFTPVGAVPVVAPTCSVTGNQATFNFLPIDIAQVISLSGIRVNIAASGLTAGAAVTGSLTVSPTIAAQLAITEPTKVLAFAYASTFTMGKLTIASCGPAITTPAGTPATLALGNPDPSGLALNSLKVTLSEGFPTAWQVTAGEDGGAGLQGTRFRIVLTGIPTGFTIYTAREVSIASEAAVLTDTGGVVGPAASPLVLRRVGTTATPVNADGSGGAVNASVLGQFDRVAVSSGTVTIVYEAMATEESTGAVPALNSATVYIAVTGVATTGTGVINGAVGYAPVGPATTVASRPQFVAGAANPAVTVTICATYLLFPWVAYTADGAYDTGFAISNTTADPSVIGTVNQTGDVTMYFYEKDGATLPAPVKTVTVATGLKAGNTTTYTASQLGAKFLGYAIAVCNFQLGHGFAFINNPSPGTGGAFAQGYLALSVTNPRALVTESVGH